MATDWRMDQSVRDAVKNATAAAALLGLAFGSAFGIPRGYTVKREGLATQSSADGIAQIDAANAKRARKAAKRLKSVTP